ncbi:C-type lectin domain family 12 member B-like [Myripristis murdjan]|uniref:C-type lectin domain family 12 member B-like n=1 Tax=Myripristis murdjan TaxID=586833 RepID=A0A667Y4U4_9TELE|nr:C-type lectin domain family 12 member B-like [Myripristis murdjan]XP_029900971.1 C-type lectin domain family 12 member B-like [Myripristis murdjan]XP_029900972.1 C-type lectin domain family 12 member B-like [Myripristis murdjan]XP_029900973.1 C-type lectin domain family 12 member B-like [Myripristis murdjan]
MASSDEGSTDGHTFRGDARYLGSLLRGKSFSVPHYRLVILCLGLLDIILLLAALVIGVYCGTLNEIHVPEHSPHWSAFSELKELQFIQKEAINAKVEAQQALEKAISQRRQQILQLEVQGLLNDGLQNQIEQLRAEKTKLMSNMSSFQESCGRCPSGWFLLRTSCYFHAKVASFPKKSWADSRADCISRGADLVKIDNWEEQITLFEYLPTASSQPRSSIKDGIWIGLTHTRGNWVWVNNVTQVDPGFWIDGEPNNLSLGEDCVAIYNRGNPRRTWFDENCTQNAFEWLCEKELS